MSKQQLSSQTLLLLTELIFQSDDHWGDWEDDDHPEYLHWHLQGRRLAQWRRAQVRRGVQPTQVSPSCVNNDTDGDKCHLLTRGDHPANALTVDSRVLSPGTSNLISMKKRRVDRWISNFLKLRQSETKIIRHIEKKIELHSVFTADYSLVILRGPINN